MEIPEKTSDEYYSKSRSVKKQDGTECQGLDETLKRLEEWAKEFFSNIQDTMKPRIEHIPGE